MRVNLDLKADALGGKVRTKNDDPNGTDEALEQLYQDALEIYETAREEVLIPRKDGGEQK